MPRYEVTRVEDVTVVEFEGIVVTRRFWWLGAVDALLLSGHRDLVVSFAGARLQHLTDATLVAMIGQSVVGHGGHVVFVPPPGRRGAAKVRSVARDNGQPTAPTVPDAVAAVRALRQPATPRR